MSHQLVHQFTVSKSLLKSEGNVDPGIVKFLYRMKSTLNKEYRQWRIAVTPEEMVLKLQNLEGEIVLNVTLPTYEDWCSVLAYYLAVPIEEEYSVR